jgi:SAM-dependent methyltransferase
MTALPLDLAAFAGLPAIPEDTVTHGEVFTRQWVVETILDLVDWRADRDLAAARLVEPACGTGAFLRVIARRVSESCKKRDRPLGEAAGCVRAFDLLPANVAASRRVAAATLVAEGWDQAEVGPVVRGWISQGDYLLSQPDRADVDVVVGNPPYIRLEDLPGARAKVYRSLWPTMVGRADIYVGFIEAGLTSLAVGGTLAFICADRWMRNQYGRGLRTMIANGFAVETVIGMHDVDAFDETVSAYPAIVVLRHGPQAAAVVADTTASFNDEAASDLVAWVRGKQGVDATGRGWEAARVPWQASRQPWPAAPPPLAAALADLNRRFPAIAEPASGVRVGIGVATGADQVFITNDGELVEDDRLLPLAMVRDTGTGAFVWSGHYLVNPWAVDGRLVSLSDHPRLSRYLNGHAELLASRHVGRRQPTRWYRTIDKVDHTLVGRPKLLFPDLKAASHPVLEPGGYYPHHNLYWLVSDSWDLEVLGGLLLSAIAEAFVGAYGVRMRGGTLRFQAQYLRLIRVPAPESVSRQVADALIGAFRGRDRDAATDAAISAYGLAGWPR